METDGSLRSAPPGFEFGGEQRIHGPQGYREGVGIVRGVTDGGHSFLLLIHELSHQPRRVVFDAVADVTREIERYDVTTECDVEQVVAVIAYEDRCKTVPVRPIQSWKIVGNTLAPLTDPPTCTPHDCTP